MPEEIDLKAGEFSINNLHDETLIQYFINGMNKKVFILTPSFPFVFIGEIIDVIGDHVLVDVDITSIQQLEKRKWHIHIHQIEVFYIEHAEGPKIPELKDDM